MKTVYVQGIDASDVVAEKITLATETQKAVASLLNSQGKNVVEAWFMGFAGHFNADFSKIRNGALAKAIGQYDRQYAGVSTANQAIVDTPNGKALQTEFSRYPFNRQGSTDWTVAAVVQISADIPAGNNTSVFGWNPGDTTSINIPSLNINTTGTVRAFLDAGQDTATIFAVNAAPNIQTKPYCIVIGQNRTTGTTCRVNGVVVDAKNGTNPNKPSQGTLVSFMGSDIVSAAFHGLMYESILTNEDVTQDRFKIETIEHHLMTAYNVVPD